MKDISRRDFLKLGGLLAAGSFLSPLLGMGNPHYEMISID